MGLNKLEYGKCELLMEKAIVLAKQSEEEGNEADRHYANMDDTRMEIARRKSDQHYGEASGIEMVLTAIGFKHDRMKELSGLL